MAERQEDCLRKCRLQSFSPRPTRQITYPSPGPPPSTMSNSVRVTMNSLRSLRAFSTTVSKKLPPTSFDAAIQSAASPRPALASLGSYATPGVAPAPVSAPTVLTTLGLANMSPSPAHLVGPTAESALLHTLARLIMRSGHLSLAHSQLALCLSTLALATASPPLPLLQKAIEIVSPSIRLVGRRKGTKSLPTPQPLTADQRTRQAFKWIVEASEKRKSTEKVFGKRLAAEVLGVLAGQSECIKKKEARHIQGVTGRANVGR